MKNKDNLPISEYISVTQAADELGVTKRWVQKLIAAGRLKTQRIGNILIVKKADLEKLKNLRRGRPKNS